jgi:hypothetical protein
MEVQRPRAEGGSEIECERVESGGGRGVAAFARLRCPPGAPLCEDRALAGPCVCVRAPNSNHFETKIDLQQQKQLSLSLGGEGESGF